MNILMISPGFPAEMPLFTRGLSIAGARVVGIGDQAESFLDGTTRPHLAAYFQVESLWNEAAVVEEVVEINKRIQIEQVECLWEPAMVLAARIREALGLPGLTVDETIPYRDKERMKQVLDAAGIRTPHHYQADSPHAIRESVEKIGFPVIIKPIAGAGSADTYRVDDFDQLDTILPRIAHVPEVSVEEFVEGTEYTFDTLCSGGKILVENVSWYRPRPLIARSLEWVSPQTVCLRNLDRAEIQCGMEMGRKVLAVLGFETGFTHMEWFRTDDGEAVFGEIAARSPGAKSVDIMNYAGDVDMFTGWAEAVVCGSFTQKLRKRYNAAVIFKRARGEGRITRIEGLEQLMGIYGPGIVGVELLPVGAHRRNWRATLLSDGWVFLRHPDLQSTLEMADRVGTDLQIYAQ